MTTIVTEIYDALRKVGLDEETARKAAQAVIGTEEKEQLVTKDFLRAAMAELKTDVIKWNVGMLMAMTGIFAAIVKLL